MKTQFFKSFGKPSLIAGLLVTFTIVSCKPDKPERPGPITPKDPIETKCEHSGEFVKIMCGVGFYNDYWIKLEDGTLLMPCEVDSKSIPVQDVHEGMKVSVSYYAVKKDCHTYDNVIRCQAVVPLHTVAHITCLERKEGNENPPVENPTEGCNEIGILHDDRGKLDGCGWSVTLTTGEQYELGTQVDETLFKDGDRVAIGYKKMYTANDCMRGTMAKITCIMQAKTNNIR